MNVLCALALLFALAQPPTTLDLEIVAPTSGEAELVITDLAQNAPLRKEKVNLPFRGQIALEKNSASGYRLEVESAAYWAAPIVLSEPLPVGPLKIPLFERGDIVFAEVPPAAGNEAPPLPIYIEVSSTPLPQEKEQLKKTRLSCRQAGDKWTCPAPALQLDLRLDKEGHVPRYVWGARVEKGKKLDLGRLLFQRGASIAGFVTVDAGAPLGTRLVLEPAGAWLVQETRRRELHQVSAVANERGFFQLQGVAPGGYRIEATREGLTPAELTPVEVLEGRETSLAAPIHLPLPAILELHVSPPLGPLGKPWKVRLLRTSPGSNVAAETIEGECDERGVFTSQALRPAMYILDIANPDGEKTGAGDDSVWLTQFVELLPGQESLYVDIPVIEVEGTFKAGDDPLQGRLIFGGFHGSPHVVMWSNEDGEFAGTLPREGEWKLDAEVNGQLLSLAQVTVERRGGRPARVEVRLPDTRFHGRVTHKGKPIEGVELWGLSTEPGKRARFDCTTDKEGRFDLRGAHPGRYGLTASSARLRLGAPKLFVEIHEGVEDPELEIELEGFVKIEGQVVAGGTPVPMAQFRAILRARQGEDTRQGQSTAAGVFGLMVPDSTREIGVVVAASGFAWQIHGLRPGAQGFPPILVDLAQDGGTLRLQGVDPATARIFYGGVELPLYLLRQTIEGLGYYGQEGAELDFENAAPGHYRICAGERCEQGLLGTGGTLELDFHTETQERGGTQE